MTERNVAEIREYCEAATGGEDGFQYEVELGPETAAQVFELSEPNARFYANARTDLPRVLDAAVKLREARSQDLLNYYHAEQHLDYAEAERYVQRDSLLRETAWLAEGGEGEG